MQGIVKSYNPATRTGLILIDKEMSEIAIEASAIEESIFRMLRPGQRIVFDKDDSGQAINLRLGSEIDMATPENI